MSRLAIVRQMARRSPLALAGVIAVSVGAAGANTAMLATINNIIRGGDRLAVWGAAFGAALVARSALTILADHQLIDYSSKLLMGVQRDTLRAVLKAPVRSLEKVGHQRIVTLLTDDLESIQDGFMLAPYVATHAMVLVGGSVYLAWLYWPLLLALAGFAVVAVTIQRLLLASNYKLMAHIYRHGDQLTELFFGATRGAKELKFSRFFTQKLSSEVHAHQLELKQLLKRASMRASFAENVTQFALYGVLGGVAFLAPQFFEVSHAVLAQYVVAILFLVGPLRALLSIQNQWIKAGAAVDRVAELSHQLEAMREELPDVPADLEWGRLALRDVRFRYDGESETETFEVGPVDLVIPRGQMVFLVGGNGSGKTTLLKLMMGLYRPSSGSVQLDDESLFSSRSYRELFGGVLTDYHLFEWVRRGRDAERLLERVGLSGKVRVEEDKFSTLNLSKGQRARLALVSALLDERQIYVFDEWAADQDPEFRELFYLELLPALKARGTTVIAATHDDRYFGAADRLIRMERGRIREDVLLDANPVRSAIRSPAS